MAKIEMRAGQSRRIATGERAGQIEHSINVVAAAKIAGPKRLNVRVRVFAKAVIEGWQTRVTNFVRSRMGRFSQGPDAVLDLATELKAELKAYNADVEINAGPGNEVLDSWYADATDPGTAAEGRTVAGVGGESDDRRRRTARRAG